MILGSKNTIVEDRKIKLLENLKERKRRFLYEIDRLSHAINEYAETYTENTIKYYKQRRIAFRREIPKLERDIKLVEQKIKVITKEKDLWQRLPEKSRKAYLRRVYCVYRLYKLGLTPKQIKNLLQRIAPQTIRKYIAFAFKRECEKDSCFAQPFFNDPDYIPNSVNLKYFPNTKREEP